MTEWFLSRSEPITAGADAVFTLPALLLMLLIAVHWNTCAVTPAGRAACRGAFLMLAGYVMRNGQWLLAIWTREPPERRAEWILDVYAVVSLSGSVLCAVGLTMMAYGVMRRGTARTWVSLGVVGWVIAFVAGYVPALPAG